MSNPARATLTDLADLGINPAGWKSVPDARRQKALNAASDLLDGYLSAQFDLPIFAPYPQDLILFECVVASYFLLTNRGYNPMAGPADENIREEYKARLAWAQGIADDKITPPGIIDSSSDSALGGPFVTSSTSRGYSERGIATSLPTNIQSGPFADD